MSSIALCLLVFKKRWWGIFIQQSCKSSLQHLPNVIQNWPAMVGAGTGRVDPEPWEISCVWSAKTQRFAILRGRLWLSRMQQEFLQVFHIFLCQHSFSLLKCYLWMFIAIEMKMMFWIYGLSTDKRKMKYHRISNRIGTRPDSPQSSHGRLSWSRNTRTARNSEMLQTDRWTDWHYKVWSRVSVTKNQIWFRQSIDFMKQKRNFSF